MENHVHLEVSVSFSYKLSYELITDFFLNLAFQSDFDVCPECGMVGECVHDRDHEHGCGHEHGHLHASSPIDVVESSSPSDTRDDTYEMVTNLPIAPSSSSNEIFNTYGETLTNAQLLCRYGFVLLEGEDVNENDEVAFGGVHAGGGDGEVLEWLIRRARARGQEGAGAAQASVNFDADGRDSRSGRVRGGGGGGHSAASTQEGLPHRAAYILRSDSRFYTRLFEEMSDLVEGSGLVFCDGDEVCFDRVHEWLFDEHGGGGGGGEAKFFDYPDKQNAGDPQPLQPRQQPRLKFYINCDGSISHHLWIMLVVWHAVLNGIGIREDEMRANTGMDLLGMREFVRACLEMMVEVENGMDVDEVDPDKQDPTSAGETAEKVGGGISERETRRKVLCETAESVISLCEWREGRYGGRYGYRFGNKKENVDPIEILDVSQPLHCDLFLFSFGPAHQRARPFFDLCRDTRCLAFSFAQS
jgi:hypothetical protein